MVSGGDPRIAPRYNHVGVRKQGTTYGNSSTRANTYTGFRSEIGSIQHATSGQTSIIHLDYGFNKVHDKLYERFGGSGASGDAFAYDELRRLTNSWVVSADRAERVRIRACGGICGR